ncbi:SHOCT domain-containing protein [Argonema galeatum]|uniref:SHOCT domain-containing protein n=1 Tax=Argonema galeatum TaxID=2942762 RepID=UPI002013BC0B|nr:SHOCT domain-containing protein [Argonema galeatum]MCL1464090.1 SHOCT domain-containing protein [Argonema galeatum A003/A1]
MTDISEKLIKELQEKTNASLSDCQKALEASNGEINQAYYWLFENTNTFIVCEGISLKSAIKEITKRLANLQELSSEAVTSLKESETNLENVKQEFISLSSELEQIGKQAFESGYWSETEDSNTRKIIETISSTKLRISELEAAKNQRQEELNKGFWSRVKVAVGDILDPIYDLQKQLTGHYIELAKLLITSNDKVESLKLIASESTVTKVREITELKSISEYRKSSALSTISETGKARETLKSTARKNIQLCTNLAEIEECIDELVAVEFADELRKQAAKIKSNLNRSVENSNSSVQSSPVAPVSDGVIIVAKGVNGQLELLEDKIRIKRQGFLAFMNHGFKGDKEILIEHISAIQFKIAGPIMSGYIQFSFFGSQESKGGIFDASKDENTVMFIRQEQEQFENIKEQIEKKRLGKKTPSIAVPLVNSSYIDELEKLASLREKGIITEEEFQVKKRQILGL